MTGPKILEADDLGEEPANQTLPSGFALDVDLRDCQPMDLDPFSDRIEVAQELVEGSSRLETSSGTIDSAADIELLKRSLSRAHESLREKYPDYLSVVTLIESVLASNNWKTISRGQTKLITEALRFGTKRDHVSPDEVDRTTKRLKGHGIATGPSFDYSVNEFDDYEDQDA